MFLKEFKQYFEMVPYKSFESSWIISIKEDVHNELGFFTQSVHHRSMSKQVSDEGKSILNDVQLE